MKHQCYGATKSFKRCRKTAKFLFCRLHTYQPLLLLFITLPALFADYSTLYDKLFTRNKTVSRQKESKNVPISSTLEHNNGLIPELVEIPAGFFLKGDPKNFNDSTKSRLYLSKYYISKYEISNKQYKYYLNESPSSSPPPCWEDSKFNSPNQPVVCVNWYEAKNYCKWLTHKTGKQFSLPSVEQWEKAARGTNGKIYPWGNTPPLRDRANFNNRLGAPDIVTRFESGANTEFNIFNMAGNVAEWCSDEIYNDAIVKGGAFKDDAHFLKSFINRKVSKYDRITSIGFRVVCIQ